MTQFARFISLKFVQFFLNFLNTFVASEANEVPAEEFQPICNRRDRVIQLRNENSSSQKPSKELSNSDALLVSTKEIISPTISLISHKAMHVSIPLCTNREAL